MEAIRHGDTGAKGLRQLPSPRPPYPGAPVNNRFVCGGLLFSPPCLPIRSADSWPSPRIAAGSMTRRDRKRNNSLRLLYLSGLHKPIELYESGTHGNDA